MNPEDPIPVACELTVPEQAERRRQLRERLLDRVRELRELEDGYALRLDWSPDRLRRLGELLALESECCPFLRLTVRVEPGKERVWLELTGPPGTRALLRGFVPAGVAPTGVSGAKAR